MNREREKEIARGLLKIQAVFLRPEDPFIWASGIESPIYCDNRLILTAPEVRDLIENEMASAIKREFPGCEKLMGTSTAGIAHAAVTAHLLNMPMGYVRGSSKSHGRNNRIEGALAKGDKVVVVEDLISTGGSSIGTVNALREAGADVLGVISIFTYDTVKADKVFEDASCKKVSLCSAGTLMETAAEEGYISAAEGEEILEWLRGI